MSKSFAGSLHSPFMAANGQHLGHIFLHVKMAIGLLNLVLLLLCMI
jgi:hypothetical protein